MTVALGRSCHRRCAGVKAGYHHGRRHEDALKLPGHKVRAIRATQAEGAAMGGHWGVWWGKKGTSMTKICAHT